MPLPHGCPGGPRLLPEEYAARRAETLERIATLAAPILIWDTAKAEAWLPGLKEALEDLRYDEKQHAPPAPPVVP